MSDTDLCARCGGDCGMSRCRECGGCENTGPGGTFRPCPVCEPATADFGDEWDDDRDSWDDDDE
jgi:hypothetical protein